MHNNLCECCEHSMLTTAVADSKKTHDDSEMRHIVLMDHTHVYISVLIPMYVCTWIYTHTHASYQTRRYVYAYPCVPYAVT
jgi:hypothetical protein